MTTLSKTDICNQALSLVGSQTITDITDTQNLPAVACNTNWQMAVAEASRSHMWNCLMKSFQLTSTPQDTVVPLVSSIPTSPPAFAGSTLYTANTSYVQYGTGIYQCLVTYTSAASPNFTVDLTAGYWFQTDVFNPDPFALTPSGSNYVSGWSYQYPLPSDFLLLYALNDQPAEGVSFPTTPYEIIGNNLYTDCSQAVIKYVAYTEDATRYDSLLTSCITYLLASKVATVLRQDGSATAAMMLQAYARTLAQARTRDANEKKIRRYSPVQDSRFIGSRRYSTNN